MKKIKKLKIWQVKNKKFDFKIFFYILFLLYFCPDGGIGRHVGLKIPFLLTECEFDSRLGHHK